MGLSYLVYSGPRTARGISIVHARSLAHYLGVEALTSGPRDDPTSASCSSILNLPGPATQVEKKNSHA
ncbi:uncharacterized protein LAJ45_06751 [Morchella importuna]|uniref:uncharacterized protein n=1 Tax=Morchella importuna TaxID=1174673 RepID=UPI001E8CC8DF|nr:uncharacterized protein LAJ45_06751 [Morchella importuna]KAH8149212.1 hypothetical protein LAJ45_06751 [Morchella importuna]